MLLSAERRRAVEPLDGRGGDAPWVGSGGRDGRDSGWGPRAVRVAEMGAGAGRGWSAAGIAWPFSKLFGLRFGPASVGPVRVVLAAGPTVEGNNFPFLTRI